MNRKISILLLALMLTGFCGCKSTKSLERAPKAKRQSTVSGNKERHVSDDPLFDVVFHKSRKESEQGGFAGADLSDQERALYNQNRAIRASDDPMVRAVREKGKESKKERSNWVYGIERNWW